MNNLYSETRKDKYGNKLLSDEAFKIGYEAAKNYLDEMLKFHNFGKLKASNVFVFFMTNIISEKLTELDIFDATYEDFNQIIGAVTGEEIDTSKDWWNCWNGKKYTGYIPKSLDVNA